MNALTIKQMAADANIPVKKNDLYKVNPLFLKEEDGFNLRDYDSDEVKQHINTLTETILKGGYIPPILVREDGKGGLLLIDGHCRWKAALQAIERGATELMLAATRFKGSDADRIEVMLQSSEGLRFTPIEVAKGYLRLERLGLSVTEIAEKVGKSRNHIHQYLKLATANVDVQNMVKSGEVSAQVAIDTLHKHNDEAGLILNKAKETAKKRGKTKVTKSVIKEWVVPSKCAMEMYRIFSSADVEKLKSALGSEAFSSLLNTIYAIKSSEKKHNSDIDGL